MVKLLALAFCSSVLLGSMASAQNRLECLVLKDFFQDVRDRYQALDEAMAQAFTHIPQGILDDAGQEAQKDLLDFETKFAAFRDFIGNNGYMGDRHMRELYLQKCSKL